MITSISLRNFKSYAIAELPLAPLVFLIGANASGKSNALEAIRLLSWLAKGHRLDDIARSIQGADTLVRGQACDLFRSAAKPLTLGCSFSAMPDDWDVLETSISLLSDQLIIAAESMRKRLILEKKRSLYEVDGEPNPHTDEISVMYNNFKRGGNKPHIPCSNRQAIFYQLETPGRFGADHEESQRIIPAVTKKAREALRQVVFLDPRPSVMRDYSHANGNEITEDGSNLSSVLDRICGEDPHGKTRLLEFIRPLPEQDITDITFIRTERNDVMVRLVESFGGQPRPIDAPLLSDGTLRVLAVAAALLSTPRGAFVVIEEIDNGVHPSRAESLVKQIRTIATARQLQVLVTTHNPALLDALPNDALADVLCCYRDPQVGDSRIIRLGDVERYPELVAQGSLGELVTTRVLDRFLKDTSTPEQRRQSSSQWLEQLKQEVSE
ncbi:MAG: ATP-binding protein [Planctomycetota bacterium]|nr:ATP-binding protein [Planctomycetota bacterium]